MKKGYLSQYFSASAAKRLSAVEACRDRSNQHEFDGVSALKKVLGPAIPRKQFKGQFIYLCDEEEPLSADGELTWYDARENHPKRSENRLYFPTTPVSMKADAGDLLVIARKTDGSLLVLIAKAGSTYERQMLWLFGFDDLIVQGFSVKEESDTDKVGLKFSSAFILEQIGIEVDDTDQNQLDRMLDRFGGGFPTTRVFSAYARETLPDVTANEDPDSAAVAWMEREELLFRTLERHLIGGRLKEGFGDDVDAFISFSLSVQNRRKARAGSALENHLEHLFSCRKLRYSRTPRTEGRSRPDFIFPGETEYQDVAFLQDRLTMLGVKSTCKDRWRQILAEADRIQVKHLFTLEPGISVSQTDEMRSKNVRLVLPLSIHETYNPSQQGWLMTLSMFMGLVSGRQSG